MKKIRPKLHIIVNCTSRKRVSPKISLGEISETSLEERAEIWWERLNNPANFDHQNNRLTPKNRAKLKAFDLYAGSYWSSVKLLPVAAEAAGFEPCLWVISAGYGLISASDEIFSYSASFIKSDSDSVIKVKNDSPKEAEMLQHWWEAISTYSLPGNKPRRINKLIKTYKNDYFLIVASSGYLSAIEKDLFEGLDFLGDSERLVIITSKSKFLNDKFSKHIVSSDARLQCNSECPEVCNRHLVRPGVRGAISSSLALRIVEDVEAHSFRASKIKHYIEGYIEQSPALLKHGRTRLCDDEVRTFIADEIKKNPLSSYSLLLRKLRDSGQACEGKRFKQLYQDTKGKKNEI